MGRIPGNLPRLSAIGLPIFGFELVIVRLLDARRLLGFQIEGALPLAGGRLDLGAR